MSTPRATLPAAAGLRERYRALPEAQAQVLSAAGFLALYLVLMTVSVALAPPGSHVAAWWPAAGVSAAALLWARGRRRWVMAAAVFAVSVLGNVVGGRPLDVSLGFAIGYTAEAVVVTLLVLRAGGPRAALSTMSGLFHLVRACAAGALVAALSAGVTELVVGDGNAFEAVRSVAAAHLAGLLVVLPCFLASDGAAPRRPPSERVAQWVAVVAVTVAVFAPAQTLPLAFLPFVPLMWGAVRMGQRTVHLQILVTGAIASVLTSRGGGPAGHLSTSAQPELVLALVQLYLVCCALMVLPLSVAIRQRQDTLSDLGRSEALFRHGFNEALVGMLLLHRESDELRIVEINQVALRLLTGDDGRTEEDLLGQDWTRMVSPRSLEDTISLALFLDSGSAPGWQGELQVDARGGAWLEVALSPINEYSSDLYTAQLADVTKRLAAEAQLRSALDAERRAVEQLTELDRAKDDFVTNISHELRTPITSVIGYAELLGSGEAGALDPMQQGMIAKVQRNAERLLHLIEDVLAVSRMDAGSFTFHMAEIDVRACAWQACETLERQAADRSIRLAVAAPKGALRVTGDRAQLERALINLMSNAIKFTPPEGEVTVRLHAVDTSVVVDVEDTGIGVPEEEAHRLFERFFRSSTAQRAAVQGTGLGLTIVSSIAQAHGGRVEYRPRAEGGSVFSLTLPLSTVQVQADDVDPDDVVPPEEVQPDVVPPEEAQPADTASEEAQPADTASEEALRPAEVDVDVVRQLVGKLVEELDEAIAAGLDDTPLTVPEAVPEDDAVPQPTAAADAAPEPGPEHGPAQEPVHEHTAAPAPDAKDLRQLAAQVVADTDARLAAAVEAWDALRQQPRPQGGDVVLPRRTAVPAAVDGGA